MINRIFQEIADSSLNDADRQSFLFSQSWSTGLTWEDLLELKRVLIISEAGVGKTHECRNQAKRLRDGGEPAFFLELAVLASSDLKSMLDDDEEELLNTWLSSQSDVATFFLDSIDELQLSKGSFELAIKRLKKSISGALGRARIIITTRPVPFDKQVVSRLLPAPPPSVPEPNEDTFANIMMQERENQQSNDEDKIAQDWKTVALMPLSNVQIIEFAAAEGVEEPEEMLKDLQCRNAEEFARRPQDLIELCADWRVHKRIRTHRDQVETNIRIKLKPRTDRPEPAELSIDNAIDGASRLALAMLVTGRFTLRHNPESDDIEAEEALDPSLILSDWTLGERKALLERPLFGFASYGRVRFHHRSVAEFLAAKRLRDLGNQGMPFRALKRLLFAETKGKTIVRPSKRPIAGWLAIKDSRIFEILRDNEPAVLLNEGDPESLDQTQRNQAIRAYVERYGTGGWRGLNVPYIQIHRLATPALANEINRLWVRGIENPEIRQVILSFIELGRIHKCADIAFSCACNTELPELDRLLALDAVTALSDPRLPNIASKIASGDSGWPDSLVRPAIVRMFPLNFSSKQLCQVLGRLRKEQRYVSTFRLLPELILNGDLKYFDLEALRDGLVDLITSDLSWTNTWPNLVSTRSHLSDVLAAVCCRGLDIGKNKNWLYASALVVRLHSRSKVNDDAYKALIARLNNFNAEENQSFFWVADELIKQLHKISDPWRRVMEIVGHGGFVEIRVDRDLGWIKEALSDTRRATEDRAFLLSAAMWNSPNQDDVIGLKVLVADLPNLLNTIDERLKAIRESRKWEKKSAKKEAQKKRRYEKDLASWKLFWREVAHQPDSAFSSGRSFNTAWDLWRAMRKNGKASRASGWNRRFIELHFDKETADRLRQTLMQIWRNDSPTLASERPTSEQAEYLVRWELGLAAIYAEAEDHAWINSLTEQETKLALRYVPIEINGLPSWVNCIANKYPAAVDEILGCELTWELNREVSQNSHSFLLQSITNSSTSIATIFIPRIEAWIDKNLGNVDDKKSLDGVTKRLKQVVRMLLTHGSDQDRSLLLALAHEQLCKNIPRELYFIWLPTLMRLDPTLGVSALEQRIIEVRSRVSESDEPVTWLSTLFGDHIDGINLRDPLFTPQLLVRLMRLAYQYVPPSRDILEDNDFVGRRDYAERARGQIVNALFDTNGDEGWEAKLEMANDPLCLHFKDRILAVAEERWAEEIDSHRFNDVQAVALDRSGEAPPATNEAMFALMNDRLAELDDSLLTDSSPKEAWAGIKDERVMRREIARELKHAAKGMYKVDQEAVTAEEKETDIRLRSVVSDHEAIIEIKLAEDRPVSDLVDTIYNQLVKKYMAPEHSRSGCLLITVAKRKYWIEPNSKKRISSSELETMLRIEAQRVEEIMGRTVAIAVHILDLRPRLPTEKAVRKKTIK